MSKTSFFLKKMTERFITSTLNRREEAKEVTLRPQHFSDFPGQQRIKDQLELFVRAAKERQEALDHILLCGPPGLGKTHLMYAIINKLFERSPDLNAIYINGEDFMNQLIEAIDAYFES